MKSTTEISCSCVDMSTGTCILVNMSTLDTHPDADSIRAWLGPALDELSAEQLDRFVEVWDDCDGSDFDADTARLTATVQYLLGETSPASEGQSLLAARQNLAAAMQSARQVAALAYQDGATEVELARAIGVDRSRTLRRWLGKA